MLSSATRLLSQHQQLDSHSFIPAALEALYLRLISLALMESDHLRRTAGKMKLGGEIGLREYSAERPKMNLETIEDLMRVMMFRMVGGFFYTLYFIYLVGIS